MAGSAFDKALELWQAYVEDQMPLTEIEQAFNAEMRERMDIDTDQQSSIWERAKIATAGATEKWVEEGHHTPLSPHYVTEPPPPEKIHPPSVDASKPIPKVRTDLRKIKPRKRKRFMMKNDLVMAYQYSQDQDLIQAPVSAKSLVITALVMSRINQKDATEFQPVIIGDRELAHLLELKNPPKRKEAQNIIVDVRHLTSLIPGKPEDVTISWFDEARHNWEEHYFTFQLSKKLQPYALKLRDKYTTQYWESIVALKSSIYAIRLYGVVRQFTRYVYKDQHDVEITQLLQALCVPVDHAGVENWWIFKRDILEKAKQRIEAGTEIRFEYRPLYGPGGQRGMPEKIIFYNVQQVEKNKCLPGKK